MTARQLGMRVALREPEALEAIKRELTKGAGLKAAAEALGVGRTTLYRWGDTWPALARLLEKHTLDQSAVGSLGGSTTAELWADGYRWKRGRNPGKRNGKVRK